MIVDWCCMCKRSGESIEHLLLHCSIAANLSLISWNVGNDTSFVIRLLKFGKMLHLVYCALLGLKEIGGILMVLSDLIL